ncbi:MAG: VOC family protein [Acidobacteriota bacterium]
MQPSPIPRTLRALASITALAIASSAAAQEAYDGAYFKRVNLVVADIDRALTIYRDILGFDLDRISESSPDSYSYPVFRFDPSAKLRFATLSAGSEQVRTLALTEVRGMELPRPGVPFQTASVIRSADIDEDFLRIEALGLETTEPKFVDGREFDFHERAFVDFDGHLRSSAKSSAPGRSSGRRSKPLAAMPGEDPRPCD